MSETNNTESIFSPPKITDATGKELTKEELQAFMQSRKEKLEKNKRYLKELKNEKWFREMFQDFLSCTKSSLLSV